MVNKKDGKQKKADGNKPPTAPIGSANRASNTAPSREARQEETNQTHNNVSEAAIVKLTAALVRWTGVLAVATIGLAGVAILQWSELRKTDETLQKTLLITQRPWISVETRLNGPFSFHKDYASIPLKIIVKNVGNSPAINFHSYPVMINFTKPKMKTDDINYDSCFTEGRHNGGTSDDFTVFPGETKIVQYEAQTGFEIDGGGKPIVVSSWIPIINICTDYSSALNDKIFRTMGIFTLERGKVGNPDSRTPLNAADGTILADQLVFGSVGNRVE